MTIMHLVEAREATSQASAVNLQEFLTRLLSKTMAPVASHIEVFEENGEKKVRLMGSAVFKGDKLVGELDKAETRGLLWVIGEVKSGIIVVDSPGIKGKASIEIIEAKSKMTPELRDGKVCMKVEINAEGNLGEQMGVENLATPAAIAALEKKQAAVIEKEILAALKKARTLKTDIFGFGEAVHRKYPKEWQELESR